MLPPKGMGAEEYVPYEAYIDTASAILTTGDEPAHELRDDLITMRNELLGSADSEQIQTSSKGAAALRCIGKLAALRAQYPALQRDK